MSSSEPTKPPEKVVEAGPVAVQVESGQVSVTVAPPSPAGFDRRLFKVINELPHSPTSDRYVSVISDLGEGLGWVAGGIALAILGGPRGRRAGAATAVASLAATYVVQVRVKPLFRHSFPSGHSASSFAAATALAFFYPKAASVAYTLATGVALSRVHLGVHFPSDTAVGGAFGVGIGTFVAWVFKKRD
jgi:undecaprenyl-diphosphatase